MSNTIDRMTLKGVEMFQKAKSAKLAELEAKLPEIEKAIAFSKQQYEAAEGEAKTPWAEAYRTATIQRQAIEDFKERIASPFSFNALQKVGL